MFSLSVGGVGQNIARVAAALLEHGNVELLSGVADDLFGNYALKDVQKHGVVWLQLSSIKVIVND